MKIRLLRVLAGCLVSAAGLVYVPANAQTTVEVVGDRPTCVGDCSGVVWGASIIHVGVPGSGVSNTTYAAGNNDGTTGTQPIFNRTSPGCQREGFFWQETLSNALAGNPLGVVIMTSFGDPLYQDAGWVKMQYDRIYEHWERGWTYQIEYRTQIHYMYNVNTGQVAQMKLKNSFAYGCQGYTRSLL